MSADKRHANLVFQPSGKRGEAACGQSIAEAGRSLGVELETPCGGKQTCGKCRVRLEEGDFPKLGLASRRAHGGGLHESERKFLSPELLEQGFRLACAATVEGDLAVYLPEEVRRGRQVISKQAGEVAYSLRPSLRGFWLELAEPGLDDPLPDWERLARAMERQHGISGLFCGLEVMRSLPGALRRGKFRVRLDLRHTGEVIRVCPEPDRPLLGLALDLGTTTLAGYLCDLERGELLATASRMTPQCKYGEDVVARISHHQMNPGGLAEMAGEVIRAINLLAEEALAGLPPAEGRPKPAMGDIVDMVLCGNSTMSQIFLGIDPEPIGVLPFTPARGRGLEVGAGELGLGICPSARVLVMPLVSGYVGGDAVAASLAALRGGGEESCLLVDIGTNGEVVLSHRGRLWCTSCATGPALEGAQIEFGMRAAPGAIERVRIDPDSFAVDYKVVGRDQWLRQSRPGEMRARGICGSGILDAVAQLHLCGLVPGKGAMLKEHPCGRLRLHPESGMPEFVLAWAEETALGRDIVITQKDVRMIQLAKAALYTGCKLLMRSLGVERLDGLKIAGSFGAHVDHAMAMAIGMFPDIPLGRISGVGNAAGDGCRAVLLDLELRQECQRLAEGMHNLELTREADFQVQLAMATHLPHKKDEFPLSGAGR